MAQPHPDPDVPVTVVDGGLFRLMTDDVTVWVEQWIHGNWVAGGALVDEVLKGPPASAATMKLLGYTPPAN